MTLERTQMSVPTSKKNHRFVEYLAGFVEREDRGALATLRRGLRRPAGEVPALYLYLGPWIPDKEDRSPQEADLFLVAELFALWHQGKSHPDLTGNNIGEALRQLSIATGKQAATEHRLLALLQCPREDLDTGLHGIISLLRSHNIPVDWSQLLTDLQFWDKDTRKVQQRYARAFWRSRPESETSSPT